MENKKMTIGEIVETEAWKTFMKKLELYGAIAFMVGCLLMLLKIKIGRGMLFTLGLSTLGIVYYFIGFTKLKAESKILSATFYKIYGWSLSFAMVTVLFTMEHWPFPKKELFVLSVCGVLASLILGIRLKNQGDYEEINKLFFIRLILALGLLAYIYLNYIQL